jgi:uncharacterized protein YndB with AHSA1/START domain
MTTHTIRLHRVLRTTPERVYRAFLDADAMSKWLPPNGFTGKVHHMDAKLGGSLKMSFTNFTTGKSHSFGGEYLELIPHERIRYTDVFDDPNLALDPPPDGDVIGAQAALGEQLLDVAVRKGKAQVPPHCQKDHFRFKLPPLE